MQVVFDAYSRGRAGVETGEAAVFEGDVVVEADEFHEHVTD